MSDPLSEREQATAALNLVAAAAEPYLGSLGERPVHDHSADHLLDLLEGPLSEEGEGTMAAVEQLLAVGTEASTQTSGPRFFHFVVGGATPAAQAADWVTSLLDQSSGLHLTSPLAARAERVALDWLKDLFGLPPAYGGVLTPSATFANLTGLACARQWWGERHGADVTSQGLAGLPRMPVLAGGYIHPSSRKALQMLGVGRDGVTVCARDEAGRVDLEAMERELAALEGPAVIVGNAGEVNTGDFDPIADLADLAGRYGAWLHVDGAFGLFAAASPRLRHLVEGVERADSITADGHKWLNVPYESGFAFVRDQDLMFRSFGAWGAHYLPSDVNYNNLGPESSRRARALPIWATLRAYGRQGYARLVERHHDLALHLAEAVDKAPDMELLAPVPLCVVCFRYRPEGTKEKEELDDLNRRLGAALLADGRVYAGTTTYRGVTALRPAIVNWRTTEADIDYFWQVLRELADRL
ncbi:pyridoxal phosphate-dependent decarboxylase family protein [Nonomuraea dietziae]|uniref:Glutamate/tyrosine decarboxylase-like PLP-dependent enzyme n=1 Tax=Nonomuraea dietziae TaxID=65515 RepID=A0A7W5YA10_9ACTN|nr:pyridoxal-dependent decarboxylase [Nonomuraea dietziae]MBB3726458.1 glutamate/tyrosine decarboxylase-like PLP-dependent enzyme [Nonomuraea dietziae]